MAPARRRGADDEATAQALSLRGWAMEAEAAAGIAKTLAPTAFVPDSLKVWTNPQERDRSKRVLDLDRTVQQVAAVLLAGQELDFKPMASLRAFVIIRDTVAMTAIAARALMLANAHEIVVTESTSTRAVVKGKRAGVDHWQQSVWDLDRARAAGLYPGHSEGNWKKQTKAMLVARASAEVSRWIAADAMLGLPLIAEEVADDYAGALDTPDQGGESNGQVKATKATKRRTVARAELPAGSASPPPNEPASDVPPPDDENRPRPSRAELSKLHAGLKDVGVTGRAEGLALVAAWAEHPDLKSTGHLTPGEMAKVLTALDHLRALRAQDQGEDVPPDDRGPQDAEPE